MNLHPALDPHAPKPTSLLTSSRLSRLIRTLPGSFSTSQLNTHQSETLVRLVAAQCGIEEELGENSQKRPSRQHEHARCLSLRSQPSHSRASPPQGIAAFLNQIEIWFSLLVRRLLSRLSCRSVQELRTRILAFIPYCNRTSKGAFRLPVQRTPCTPRQEVVSREGQGP